MNVFNYIVISSFFLFVSCLVYSFCMQQSLVRKSKSCNDLPDKRVCSRGLQDFPRIQKIEGNRIIIEEKNGDYIVWNDFYNAATSQQPASPKSEWARS